MRFGVGGCIEAGVAASRLTVPLPLTLGEEEPRRLLGAAGMVEVVLSPAVLTGVGLIVIVAVVVYVATDKDSDKDERERCRKVKEACIDKCLPEAVAEVLTELGTKLLDPIYAKYPDLAPSPPTPTGATT